MHISCECCGRDVLRLTTWSFFISFHSRQEVLHFMSRCRSPEVIPSTTSTVPPLGARLADVTSTSSTSTTKSSCGRFQFQCQTSKECIAVRLSMSQDDWWRQQLNSSVFTQIYNVCDQIAQCDDGSDEGPEVRLPKSWRTKPKEFPTSNFSLHKHSPTFPVSLVKLHDIKTRGDWDRNSTEVGHFGQHESSCYAGECKTQWTCDVADLVNW